MATLLIVLLILLLNVGGTARLVTWLFPNLPPQIAAPAFIAGLVLVAGLLLTPTRGLAQAAILGIIRALLLVGTLLVRAFLSLGSTLWAWMREAVSRSWRRW